MFEKEGESKQAERIGNDTIGVLYRLWPEKSGAMRLFWNERLQHGEQMNRNFGIKSFLSQNWGGMCLHQNLGRGMQELEASRIVSSRNRLDVNRYQLI